MKILPSAVAGLLVALLATGALHAQTRATPPPPSQPPKVPILAPAAPATAAMIVKITVGTALSTYGAKATLRATATAGPGPLAGKPLKFFVDGANAGPYGQAMPTDGAGQAKVEFAVPADLAVGDHEIKVVFEGEPGIAGATGTGRLAVLKGATKITEFASGITKAADGKPEIYLGGVVARVTDGIGLNGRAVEVTVDGAKRDTVATDPYGRFTARVPWNKGGTFSVRADFPGDGHYTSSGAQGSATYTPPPPPAVIPVFHSKVVLVPGGPIVVGGKLTIATKVSLVPGGPGMPGVKMRLTAPNVGPQNYTYQPQSQVVDSDAMGVASATFTLITSGIGWFSADLADPRFVDGSNDGSGQLQSSTNVAKAPVSITASGPASAHVGDKIKLHVEVRNAAAPGPAPGVLVNVTPSPGGTPAGKGTTSTTGAADIDVTVPSALGIGPRQLHLEFAGNLLYEAKSVTYSLNVQPKTN